MRVAEIRSKRKAVRLEKARARKEKRQKYRKLYKEELAKHRAKLQTQKDIDIETYKTKLAIEKAQRRARGRVKPFSPRKGYKAPSKAQLTKAGIKGGKLAVKYGKYGLKTMEKILGETPKRKRTLTKRKTSKKKQKSKGKSYYCYKCHKRHSYTSKIGRKHKR